MWAECTAMKVLIDTLQDDLSVLTRDAAFANYGVRRAATNR